MRDRLFRLLAAGLFGLICYALVEAIRNGLDFTPDWTELVILGAAAFIFAPTFAVFAILGERAAYRVLIPGLALLQLPEIVLEAIIRRTVDLPEYLRDPESPKLEEGSTEPTRDTHEDPR